MIFRKMRIALEKQYNFVPRSSESDDVKYPLKPLQENSKIIKQTLIEYMSVFTLSRLPFEVQWRRIINCQWFPVEQLWLNLANSLITKERYSFLDWVCLPDEALFDIFFSVYNQLFPLVFI